MRKLRGKTIPLSVGRKLVEEMMHQARKVPSLPLSRLTKIPQVVQARSMVKPSVSWMAIFMKAYALVGKEIPEIRRTWMTFPWAHLYEHPTSECALMVEREYQGEQTVFATKIRSPENGPLTEIDAHLRRFQTDPVEEVTAFRQLLRLASLPRFLRRFFLWKSLTFSGFHRACRFGNFMISSLGNYGVEQMHPLTNMTTYFTYGPIAADGTVTLKVIYDHRVMDGRTVARILVHTEEILNTVILEELRNLAGQSSQKECA